MPRNVSPLSANANPLKPDEQNTYAIIMSQIISGACMNPFARIFPLETRRIVRKTLLHHFANSSRIFFSFYDARKSSLES